MASWIPREHDLPDGRWLGGEDDPERWIVASRDGRIRVWGRAWAQAFGYSADEALGQSLDLIVPPALQPLHWGGFTRAMERGRLKRPGAPLRVPAIHKDGSVIPVCFVGGTLIMDNEGAAEGIKLAFVKLHPRWVASLYRVVLALFTSAQWIRARLAGRRRS